MLLARFQPSGMLGSSTAGVAAPQTPGPLRRRKRERACPEMALCAVCKTQETQLYENDVPGVSRLLECASRDREARGDRTNRCGEWQWPAESAHRAALSQVAIETAMGLRAVFARAPGSSFDEESREFGALVRCQVQQFLHQLMIDAAGFAPSEELLGEHALVSHGRSLFSTNGVSGAAC